MNKDLLNMSSAAGLAAQNRYGNVAAVTVDIEDVDENDFNGDFLVDEHEEEGIAKDRVLHFSN